MIEHKHLIIRALINNPPKSEMYVNDWMVLLIKSIGMEILRGPFTSYLEDEGNRGITSACIIKTSHIVLHIWDEQSPALAQLDVYSCKDFDKEIVFSHLNEYDIVQKEWYYIDRETTLNIIDHA